RWRSRPGLAATPVPIMRQLEEPVHCSLASRDWPCGVDCVCCASQAAGQTVLSAGLTTRQAAASAGIRHTTSAAPLTVSQSFLQLFACLGSAFFFAADRVTLTVCGSHAASSSPRLRPPFFLSSVSSWLFCSTETLA